MNDASKALDYFQKINFKCPSLSSPAEYFMFILSLEAIEMEDVDPNQTEEFKKAVKERQEKYDKQI